MKLSRLVCALSVVFVALAFAKPAVADSTATSKITQIKILSKADKNFRLFHGAIWLEYDKAQFNYRWGGKHCNGRTLKGINVGMLFATFRYKYNITVDYKLHVRGKHKFRCITAFTLSHK